MNGRRFADLELELVDDARNARRYYVIRVERSLFARELVTVYGRIGVSRVERRESFASDAELARRYDAIVRTRRAHGYVERAPTARRSGPRRSTPAARSRRAKGE